MKAQCHIMTHANCSNGGWLIAKSPTIQSSQEAVIKTGFYSLTHTHHAKGVFDPNPMNKQIVTIFGYPRACRFRKH
jgi:hypothetical protein